MIVYLDASALVKCYVTERDSEFVATLIRGADTVGTGVLSRAEVAAALGRAARTSVIAQDMATRALAAFNADWDGIVRLQVGEALAARAAMLAWDQGLRGYDAVHLATALTWRESLGEMVVLATFDRELWRSAAASGLQTWPAAL